MVTEGITGPSQWLLKVSLDLHNGSFLYLLLHLLSSEVMIRQEAWYLFCWMIEVMRGILSQTDEWCM